MMIKKQFNANMPSLFESNRTQVNVGITPSTQIMDDTEVIGYTYYTVFIEDCASYTDDALEAIAKKEARAYEVSHIVVTVGNFALDGDETAQTRMSRAAQSMSDTDTVSWKDANNNFVSLTKDVLLEAVLAAGTVQTELWVKYA